VTMMLEVGQLSPAPDQPLQAFVRNTYGDAALPRAGDWQLHRAASESRP